MSINILFITDRRPVEAVYIPNCVDGETRIMGWEGVCVHVCGIESLDLTPALLELGKVEAVI